MLSLRLLSSSYLPPEKIDSGSAVSPSLCRSSPFCSLQGCSRLLFLVQISLLPAEGACLPPLRSVEAEYRLWYVSKHRVNSRELRRSLTARVCPLEKTRSCARDRVQAEGMEACLVWFQYVTIRGRQTSAQNYRTAASSCAHACEL